MKQFIITRDFRHLDANGKRWKDGGGRHVFKIRQRRPGFTTITPKGDEVEMVDDYYDDVKPLAIFETEDEAQKEIDKLVKK